MDKSCKSIEPFHLFHTEFVQWFVAKFNRQPVYHNEHDKVLEQAWDNGYEIGRTKLLNHVDAN